MILFFNPADPESRGKIEKRLQQMQTTGLRTYIDISIHHLAERIAHCDDLVREEFADIPFSLAGMIRRAARIGADVVVHMPVIVNDSFYNAVSSFDASIYRASHQDMGSFIYMFLKLDHVVAYDRGSKPKPAQWTGLIVKDEVVAAVTKAGLGDKFTTALMSMIFNFGHDFLHTVTSTKMGDGTEVSALTEKLYNNLSNERVMSGFEEFLLQLNQQIFLKARREDSVWFKSLVSGVESLSKLGEEIERKCGADIAANFKEIGVMFVSNYVPRHLLQASDMDQWVDVLKHAQPAVDRPRFAIDDEWHSPFSIIMKYQEALKADIKSDVVKYP